MRNLVWGNGDRTGNRIAPVNLTGVEPELHAAIIAFYIAGHSLDVTGDKFGISDKAVQSVLKAHNVSRHPRQGGRPLLEGRGDIPVPAGVTLPHLAFLDPANLLPFERGSADA